MKHDSFKWKCDIDDNMCWKRDEKHSTQHENIAIFIEF